MNKFDDRIASLVRQIVQWLVQGDFQSAELRSKGARLSASDLEWAVREYGRALAMPPDSAFESLDVISVRGAVFPTWAVRIDLWTEEEGRSDLTLECTVVDTGDELLQVEIDDLHVL